MVERPPVHTQLQITVKYTSTSGRKAQAVVEQVQNTLSRLHTLMLEGEWDMQVDYMEEREGEISKS